MPWAFVSDESCLQDFEGLMDSTVLVRRVRARYGLELQAMPLYQFLLHALATCASGRFVDNLCARRSSARLSTSLTETLLVSARITRHAQSDKAATNMGNAVALLNARGVQHVLNRPNLHRPRDC